MAISFSALQRAEIAEMVLADAPEQYGFSFSALQRAEIAEMVLADAPEQYGFSFSALQRAEIAEIEHYMPGAFVGVLFQCSSTSRNC